MARCCVDTAELEAKIKLAGLEFQQIAEELEISTVAFWNKRTNKTPFTINEIAHLQRMLHLTNDEVMAIFFGTDVN